MATIYTHQSENVRKTWILVVSFLVGIILLGYAASIFTGNRAILYIAILLSLLMNVASYWFSDKIVLSMAGATPIESKDQYPELWNIVENLSITAGLPMPKLYVINDPAPNAFATGRNQEHAVVAVTTGLLPMLNKSELEGVIAHELSHIGNKDMLLQTIVVVLAGVVSIVSDLLLRMSHFGGDGESREGKSGVLMLALVIVASILAPLAATIVQLAISRRREFLADASGVLLTRYPEGLASALKKISGYKQPLQRASNATAHLYIVNPMGHALAGNGEEKVSWFTKLFMTHPPVQERVKALTGEDM